MDTTLCATCRSMLEIINQEDPNWRGRKSDDGRVLEVPRFERLCHFKFADLARSADEGCALCSKLNAWALEHVNPPGYEGLGFSAEPNVLGGVWKFRFGVSDDDGTAWIHEGSQHLTFTCHPTSPPSGNGGSFYAGFALGDTSLASTGSARCLEKINHWMKDCLQNHPLCAQDPEPAIYPSRLLDLRGPKISIVSDTSQLRETKTPYATLSYSWGPNPQQLTLTTDNQYELYAHVAEDALQPTFLDAIQVTRSLGLGFLWIDSLCIIQAGEEHGSDWLGQSAIMGSIYQNCAVNIAAADGRDAQAGCFMTREPRGVVPCVVELRKATVVEGAGTDNHGIKRETAPTTHLLVPEPLLGDGVGHFHLDSRAWVCQERLLSPRTVYFGRGQLFWECSSLQNVSETVPAGIATASLPKPDEVPYMGERIGGGEAIGIDFSWGTPQFDVTIRPYGWKAPDAAHQYEWWLKILHGYVRRNLTEVSDKLLAIGAIAERTAGVLGDEYLAGLFRARMPEALLWSCARERRPREARSEKTFYAPSWSWASLTGDLDFTPLADKNSRCLSRIVSCKVDLVDPQNQYGQVREAVLAVEGPFISFDRALLAGNWTYHFVSLKLKGFASKTQLLYFDFDPSTLECNTFSLLVLRENARPRTYPTSGDMEEAGLILAPDPKDVKDRFVRIGVFKGIEYNYNETREWKYAEKAEVKIV